MSQIFGPVWFLQSTMCEASSLPSHLVRVASATLSAVRRRTTTMPSWIVLA